MRNKCSLLILLAFLVVGVPAARADQPQVVASAAANPAPMDDAALASYVTGRLKQALKDEDDKVEQSCDASGCSVVVQ
jgi:hypothetical protein